MVKSKNYTYRNKIKTSISDPYQNSSSNLTWTYLFISFDLVNSTYFKSKVNSWSNIFLTFFKITERKVREKFERIEVWKRIGDEINGSIIGLDGYKLKITGGSDKCGFPMRHDIHGSMKMRVLLSKKPGYKPTDKGIRRRKSVRGNTISSDIVQVNTKVVEAGEKPIAEILGQE